MRRLLLLLAALSGAVAVKVAYADRTEVLLSSSVDAVEMTIGRLEDGGCVASVLARVDRADGGTREFRSNRELSGTQRTGCLSMLSGAGVAIVKTVEGL